MVKIIDVDNYYIIYWSGIINDTRLRLETYKNRQRLDSVEFHSVMSFDTNMETFYCCNNPNDYQVSRYEIIKYNQICQWKFANDLRMYECGETEMLLQLKYDKKNDMLLGTAGKGFVIWDFGNKINGEANYLALPHGVRNITTKMMISNSIMISASLDYAVSGVRQVNLNLNLNSHPCSTNRRIHLFNSFYS